MCVHFISVFVVTILILITLSESNKYDLKQVIILSRHGIRTPTSVNLKNITIKPWPVWKEQSGYLTAKGAKLEGYMGAFFASWLFSKGLLPDICPTQEEFYVHANKKNRTVSSAEAFVSKGFPGCNITVHHEKSSDPIFEPMIHNGSEAFMTAAYQEMLDKMSSLNLNNSLSYLGYILDYANSTFCRKYRKCNLTSDTNIIMLKVNIKPYIIGPIKLCNEAVDAFTMEFYEGLTDENVAWGSLSMEKLWKTVMEITLGYHSIIFKTPLVAKDISKPLVRYMSDILLNDDDVPKATLLMGHDANIQTLLKAVNVIPYTLDGQYEKTPIGGAVVFQKWQNRKSGDKKLKIEYIYQTRRQLREGTKLDLENSPKFQLLELENCPLDNDGFCCWNDFRKILERF